MPDSVIGALRVVLGADTAALDSGLKDSRANLASFGTGVSIAMAAAAASVAAAAVSIVSSIRLTVSNAASLNDLSQSVGVSVEQLSKLNYAAGLFGVSQSQMASSLTKLTKSMSSVSQDGAGPAARAFSAMGVAVQDQNGNLRSASDVLADIATKFSNYRDGANKTALATAVFGDAGRDLIPLLNQGGDGLQKLGDEAQQFGLVLDTRATNAAAAFHENLKKVDAVNEGLITTITVKLLPTMEILSQQWLEFSKDVDLSMKAIDLVTSGINAVVMEMKIAYVELGAFAAQVKTLYDVVLKLFTAKAGDAGKIWDDYKASAEEYGKQIDATVATIRAGSFVPDGNLAAGEWLVQAQAVKSLDAAVVSYINNWKMAAPNIGGSADALDKFIDAQNKSLARRKAEVDSTGMAAGAQERLSVVLQGLAVVKNNDIKMTDEQRVSLTQAANAAELLGLKYANISIIGQTNPFAAISLAIDATNAKLASGSLGLDDFTRLSAQAAQLNAKLWADSATSFGGSMESIGQSLAGMNESWAAAAKVGQAISASVAFVNAYVAASESFAKTPFPANIAIAAGVLASGLKMVTAIKSVGFAAGGLVSGPGSGMSDSIPAMLSNGEFVMNAEATARNRPQLEAMNSGGSAGGVTHISLTMSDPVYSREGLRVWIDRINGMTADGYRLNVG